MQSPDLDQLIEALDIPLDAISAEMDRLREQLPGLMLKALEALRAGPVLLPMPPRSE